MNKPFNISEYFKIKQSIEQCDVFYAALYNLTNVTYSNDIDTACISFDKAGNSLDMKINPLFWDKLNEHAKTFVVLHELYHVIYNHGKRIIELGGDFKLGNIASDIVINHHINEKVGLSRESFDWKPYCWVETCFPEKNNMPTDRSFEYYYNLLQTKTTLENNQLIGSHSNGEPTKENTDTISNKDGKPSENNDFSPENFSETFKDIVEANPHIAEDILKSPTFSNMKDEIKEYLPIVPKSGQKSVGIQADYVKSNDKPNFYKLMKLLVPKKRDMNDENLEVWVGSHRRYTAFIKQNGNMMLPNTIEQETVAKKTKKEVWIFMDSSGSCHGMFNTFSNIVFSLLKEKGIHCRAFAFGDDCEEVDTKNHKIGFYSGNAGGFDCIEEKILETMKKEKIKYPDNIVVLSDGGVDFEIRDGLTNPKNWILLINNESSKHLTPPGGKYFKVDQDFFSLGKESKNTLKP